MAETTKFVCVPVEPTPEMMKIGAENNYQRSVPLAVKQYCAMLSARGPEAEAMVAVRKASLPMLIEAVSEHEKLIREKVGSIYHGEPGEPCADDWLVLADELRAILEGK